MMPLPLTEPVKAHMRQLFAMAERYWSDASPGRGYAVGRMCERAAQRAEVCDEFIRQLRKGAHPDDAANNTKEHIRGIVARHNARRLGDVNWQVADTELDSFVDTIRLAALRARAEA